nr:hypothetical protein [Tessaracoccus coleopterorum]
MRFETRSSGPGPIRTYGVDDGSLHPAGIDPLPLAPRDEDD